MSHHIVVVGRDEVLLQTRVAILSKHWPVKAAHLPEALSILKSAHCDLLIVCSSLLPSDAKRFMHSVRHSLPSLPILAIEPEAGSRHSLEADDYAHINRPQGLIEAATALLKGKRAN